MEEEESAYSEVIFAPEVMLLNVQSLNPNKSRLLEVELSKCRSVKILCLTETWSNSASINSNSIDEFKLVSHYNRLSSRGGGVAIWLKMDMCWEKISLNAFCVDKHIELCAVKLLQNNTPVVVITCYRSPDGDLKTFMDNLNDALNSTFKPYNKIILCGDFNINSFIECNDYDILCSLLKSYGLADKVWWPTRVTQSTVSIIDHAFTNIENGTCYVFDNIVSDHRTVYYETDIFKITPKTNNKVYELKRIFRNADIQKFLCRLVNQDWDGLYCLNDLNDAFDYFHGIFRSHFEDQFPLKMRTTKTDTYSRRWINSEILTSSIKLKDLYIMKSNYPQLSCIYKQAKLIHLKLVRNSKRRFFQNKIFTSDNPNKTLWKIISELTHNEPEISNNIEISVKDTLLNDPSLVADSFNEFFKQAPKDLIKNISVRNNTPADSHNIDGVNQTLFLHPYVEEELLSLVKNKIKPKWSAGPDDIPPAIIKKVLSAIITPLTYLINLSFEKGQFPELLKTSKIIPIHKKKDKACMENYRPVAISSSFSKFFEQAFLGRLQKFLDNHNVLSKYQHGFRNNLSTNTAMIDLYNNVVSKIEAGECPVGIFCDLSRAFDCVNHNLLITKLFSYGCRGNSLDWVVSYLENRHQYVVIPNTNKENFKNQISSNIIDIDVGVPQGSVLGPILFLLYVNDIESIFKNVSPVLYADDTSIIISDRNEVQLEREVNILMTNLQSWFSTNNIYINSEKTQVIRFRNRQNTCKYIDLKCSNLQHNTVDTIKFLGLMVDTNLNFKSHAKILVPKLNSLCYLLRNLKIILNIDQLVNIYHAHVESRIRYGICLWGGSPSAANVFISQKRAIRTIAGASKHTSCKSLFKKLNILTLPSLYIFEMSVHIYKNRHNLTYVHNVHKVNTRQKHQIHVPFKRCNVGVLATDCMGVRIFNYLPVNIQNCQLISSFRKNLKVFLTDKCYYSLGEFFQG